MVALLLLTRRRDVMGLMATGRGTMALAWVAVAATVVLNAMLLADAAGLRV
jgi:Mn2+/Fe2+ NRAMP family transporter